MKLWYQTPNDSGFSTGFRCNCRRYNSFVIGFRCFLCGNFLVQINIFKNGPGAFNRLAKHSGHILHLFWSYVLLIGFLDYVSNSYFNLSDVNPDHPSMPQSRFLMFLSSDPLRGESEPCIWVERRSTGVGKIQPRSVRPLFENCWCSDQICSNVSSGWDVQKSVW